MNKLVEERDVSTIQTAFVWFAVCCINHLICDFYSALLIPSFANSLSSDQRKSWTNRSSSTLHATVMSILFCYYWLVVYDSSSISRGIGDFEYMAMYIMCGYLVYDSIYEISSFVFNLLDTKPVVVSLLKKDKPVAGTKNKRSPLKINYASLTIIAHHLVGLMAHIAILKFKCGLAARYMMLIYGAEMSTPWLNACWILMSMNLKQTKLYKVCGSSLILSFVWRNFIGVYTVLSMIIESSSWKGSTLNGRQYHKDELLYWLLFAIAVVFVLLNATWSYKLAKSAIIDVR
jgi:hypothetical protein